MLHINYVKFAFGKNKCIPLKQDRKEIDCKRPFVLLFSQETADAFLQRPGHGGFGLLIARDKTLPPPALFIREVTPGGIAAQTGLVDKGQLLTPS